MQAVHQIADIIVTFPLTTASLARALDLWIPERHGMEIFQTLPEETLGIELVRDLKEFLSTTSSSSRGRLVVLADAARLTLPAQHALLKTIEEHPKDTKIGLFTSRLDALLPTIISRCMTHELPKEDTEGITLDELLSMSVEKRLDALIGMQKATLETMCIGWLYQLESSLRRDLHPSSYQAAVVTSYGLSLLSHQVSPDHVATILSLKLPHTTR